MDVDSLPFETTPAALVDPSRRQGKLPAGYPPDAPPAVPQAAPLVASPGAKTENADVGNDEVAQLTAMGFDRAAAVAALAQAEGNVDAAAELLLGSPQHPTQPAAAAAASAADESWAVVDEIDLKQWDGSIDCGGVSAIDRVMWLLEHRAQAHPTVDSAKEQVMREFPNLFRSASGGDAHGTAGGGGSAAERPRRWPETAEMRSAPAVPPADAPQEEGGLWNGMVEGTGRFFGSLLGISDEAPPITKTASELAEQAQVAAAQEEASEALARQLHEEMVAEERRRAEAVAHRAERDEEEVAQRRQQLSRLERILIDRYGAPATQARRAVAALPLFRPEYIDGGPGSSEATMDDIDTAIGLCIEEPEELLAMVAHPETPKWRCRDCDRAFYGASQVGYQRHVRDRLCNIDYLEEGRRRRLEDEARQRREEQRRQVQQHQHNTRASHLRPPWR